MVAHAELLRDVTKDDALVAAARADWRSGPIDDVERAMLDYVEKLTRDCASVKREDFDALHAAGFDDTGILQINLITSFFNYINRVADGLGVGKGV